MSDLVAAGWEALSRGSWDEALVLTRDAENDPEALEVAGVAYWWLDDADATIDSRERAYRLYRERSEPVPPIHVKLIENVFSPDEKREIIERLTDTMVEIEGENMRSVTWVTLEEVSSGDWGMAGNAVMTEDVKALRAGVAA